MAQVIALPASKSTEAAPLPIEAKERLVVQGFAERGAGTFRPNEATSSLMAQNTLCQVCASHGMSLESLDVKGAYLSRNGLERLVVLKQPPGGLPGVPEGRLLRARKAVYGMIEAARMWWLELVFFINYMRI